MKSLRRIACLVAMGVAMQAGSAAGSDARSCGAFEVHSTGENRKVSYVDNGLDGDSAGDQRIGYRTIRDKDGKEIGAMRWIVTVLETAPGGEGKGTGLIRQHFLLPEGEMVVERVYGAGATFSDTEKVTVKGGDLAVVGGTGTFKGAGGIMHKVRDPDGGLGMTYKFDVACD